ncbi:carbohydrate-binding module family 50 protein [Trichoderma cornu-damae]|uniref:Carbohydrate-binding module family 50 protein n=1 Tax=Trichoderma cornu-damae TaxID=654480 RepID=A0A9P8QWA3_9HYPO|nr:carbohydrate-binding module family 50 protein [Trichoderma cornu-damae]
MSRFSRYDTDEERLPEGMTRVGYDADTQVYTFQDADGSYWESAPGSQYGRLTQVSGPADDAGDSEPFLSAQDPTPKTSWRHDMMPLLNFGVLVGLSLLALFWFIGRRAPSEALELVVICPGRSITVQANDTCWDLAQAEGISVDDLVGLNAGLDCGKLMVGSTICLSA